MEVTGPSEFEDSWKLVRAKAELDLQMDVYVSGSSNAARIRGRVSLLTNMFLDFKSLRIDLANLTEWEAALWTRSRVNSGAKTAGSSARTALSLAEKFSGEFVYADSVLVRPRLFPRPRTDPSGTLRKLQLPSNGSMSGHWKMRLLAEQPRSKE